MLIKVFVQLNHDKILNKPSGTKYYMKVYDEFNS